MEYIGLEMKYKYYVRYHQSNDETQTFEQFCNAIASTASIRLVNVIANTYNWGVEYVTIWEIHQTADFLLLENRIADALQSRQFNNK
jgi:hypothetical protein